MEDNNVKELELDALIGSFYTKKLKLDEYKKETDIENKRIKELMTELDISEYESTLGEVAKLCIQNRESFNESALIERLMEINASEAIELVPTINWDIIEDMIYNGRLNATELTPYKEEKKVVTLKVTKKKGE